MKGTQLRNTERRRWSRVAVRSPFLVCQGDQIIAQGLTLNLGKGGALLELNGTQPVLASPEPVQVEIALPRGRYVRPQSLHSKAVVTRRVELPGKLILAVEFLSVVTGDSSNVIDSLSPFLTGSVDARPGVVV